MKKSIETFKYQALIYLFFITELLLRMPTINEMDGWRTTLYAITYKYGFIERAFVGSVFRLFTKHLTTAMIYYSCLVLLIIIFFIFSKMLAKIITSFECDIRSMAIFLVLLYLSSPISIIRFTFARNYASFDVYLIFVSLLCVLVIDKPWLKYFVPILSLVELSIHHASAFTYFMFVFGILLYQWYKSSFSKKEGVLASITVLTSILLFLYYQFIGIHVPFDNPDALKADILKYADIPMEEHVIIRYYVSAKEYFINWCVHGYYKGVLLDLNMKGRILATLLILTVLTPLILVFVSVWKNTISACDDKKGKCVYRFFLFCPIFSLPLFVIATDWDRWMIGIFFTQLLFVFYLIKNNDLFFKIGLEQTYTRLKGSKEFLLYFYMLLLSVFRYIPLRFSIGTETSAIISKLIESFKF